MKTLSDTVITVFIFLSHIVADKNSNHICITKQVTSVQSSIKARLGEHGLKLKAEITQEAP